MLKNNMDIIRLACVIYLLFLAFIPITSADTQVIYDNITTSNYKTMRITSDLCSSAIALTYTCNHKLYINGFFSTTFKNGELISYPDNSTINVELDDPINTNLQNLPDSKSNFIIMVMAFMQPVLPWFILFLFIYLVWKRETKRSNK